MTGVREVICGSFQLEMLQLWNEPQIRRKVKRKRKGSLAVLGGWLLIPPPELSFCGDEMQRQSRLSSLLTKRVPIFRKRKKSPFQVNFAYPSQKEPISE